MDENNQMGDTNNSGWQFKPESSEEANKPSSSPKKTSTPALAQWTASEYVDHRKGPGWYFLLILAALLITFLIYLFTRDILSSIVILVLLGTLGVAAGRKPRVLEYRIDTTGLAIGSKFYTFDNFKSFTLEEAGPVKNITFLPMKRFMPAISIYFAPEDEIKVTSALSQFLPYEQRRPSSIDRFMRSIRF